MCEKKKNSSPNTTNIIICYQYVNINDTKNIETEKISSIENKTNKTTNKTTTK